MLSLVATLHQLLATQDSFLALVCPQEECVCLAIQLLVKIDFANKSADLLVVGDEARAHAVAGHALKNEGQSGFVTALMDDRAEVEEVLIFNKGDIFSGPLHLENVFIVIDLKHVTGEVRL